jgi:hypothetical protein
MYNGFNKHKGEEMNDIYKRYNELEEVNYQLEVINSVLWEYISEKDILEIDKRLENI